MVLPFFVGRRHGYLCLLFLTNFDLKINLIIFATSLKTMDTKKQVVDRIKTKLRQLSKDRWMSNRFVLKILEEKTRNLLSQKLRDRSLYREANIYSAIDCFEFEKVESFSCDIVEFKTCQKIMKSKKKLPELIYSRFGDSIRIVSNIDQTERLVKTTPPDYQRSRKRKFNNNPPMFYERGGYLYLLNTEMEVGFIELLTLDTETAERIDCNCEESNCKGSLDYSFIGSDKLKEVVIQQTIQELVQTYVQIQPDENPDNNENSV